jgi:hypothetical protein
MQTECTTKLFEFEAVDRRAVVAGFDGGDITSNAGGLLLGLVDRGLGLVRRFAECFRDRRNPSYLELQVGTIVWQRIFGLVLGNEDLNDHDELRKDPVFKTLAGKLAPVLRSDCEALAGKSTLNRVEHTRSGIARSIRRLIETRHWSIRCWSISFSRGMRGRRARSCSISTIATSRCTACRRDASITAIMTNIAICRSMCSAAGTCCWPGRGVRTLPAAMARSKKWRGSLRRSAKPGRACA